MSDPVLITLIIAGMIVAIFAIAAFAPRRESPTERYLNNTDKSFTTPMWTSETTYKPEDDKETK